MKGTKYVLKIYLEKNPETKKNSEKVRDSLKGTFWKGPYVEMVH